MSVPADLLAAAKAVRERAFVPYSHFPVAAVLRTASGRIHAGVNVENVAYPQSQCAEASAIGVMVAAGETRIAEVLVLAGGERLIAPCGGCRQRLAEFAAPEVPVHLCHPDGRHLRTDMAELLPHAFGPGHLSAGTPSAAAPDAAARIRTRLPQAAPAVAIVLGSGLGGLVDELEQPEAFDYADLPGFPTSGVPGHAGRLVLGRLSDVPVMCFQGRVHLYEGRPAAAILPMIRLVHELGCRRLVLTNAAGSLRPDVPEGAVSLIADHINLQGSSPLVGGPNFVGLTSVYDPSLRSVLGKAAARLGMELPEGVYLAVLGPQFETPAEIRAFRTLGADLVGMSTVAEAIAARHLGIRVAGLSAVTNLAAGMTPAELSHNHTLAAAKVAGDKLRRLLAAALPDLARA
ncbi:purine-nucleoside phosphorylase [Geminicoccus roseus]|uniref:purine-nucleoside phosphorylase n=1 Tax=Geminicoccus roseus TaxID=404900 RepID=UPI00040346C4|nr:purine-nucleoside phosphorylase [Geminicoccus roseus]